MRRKSTREPMRMKLEKGTTVIEIAIPNRIYKAIRDIEEHLTLCTATDCGIVTRDYEIWRYDDEMVKEHILEELDKVNLRKVPKLIPRSMTKNNMLIGLYLESYEPDDDINIDEDIFDAIFTYIWDIKGQDYASEALYEWYYHMYNVTKHATRLKDIEEAFENIEYRGYYDDCDYHTQEDCEYQYVEEEDDYDYSIITVMIEVGSIFKDTLYKEMNIDKPIIAIDKELNERRKEHNEIRYKYEDAEWYYQDLFDKLEKLGHSIPYDIG